MPKKFDNTNADTNTNTERFTVNEEYVSIYDTQRDLYYQVVSNKTAAMFAKEFNENPAEYADIINNLYDWTNNPVPQESDDTIFNFFMDNFYSKGSY